MEKTIKIGEKSVKLNNNIGWTMVYRDQFGRDIVPALLPLAASLMDVINGLIKETGKTEDINLSDIAAITDGDYLIDAIIHLGSFEFSDLINMVWSLAKCADESIPEPRIWVQDFDTFPLDVIIPEVSSMIFKGVVSSKNLKRLEDLKKKIQPALTSIRSSLQELKED